MFGLGAMELTIILLIVVILFGARKLPEIGAGLGKAISNFKRATGEPEEIDVTSAGQKKEAGDKPQETAKESENKG